MQVNLRDLRSLPANMPGKYIYSNKMYIYATTFSNNMQPLIHIILCLFKPDIFMTKRL